MASSRANHSRASAAEAALAVPMKQSGVDHAPIRSMTRARKPPTPRGLPEMRAPRKRSSRSAVAARFRRHLRSFGLQRIVEHVEAEPDRRHGDRRSATTSAVVQRRSRRYQEAAHHRQAGLSEPVDQLTHEPGDRSARRRRSRRRSDRSASDLGQSAHANLRRYRRTPPRPRPPRCNPMTSRLTTDVSICAIRTPRTSSAKSASCRANARTRWIGSLPAPRGRQYGGQMRNDREASKF